MSDETIINYLKEVGKFNLPKNIDSSNTEIYYDYGGKRNSEYFFIECKGKSNAKSANSINKEGWLNALGQIITRMDVKRFSISKEDEGISGINHAYKYGLGLYLKSAQVALRRIPKEIAEVLCLHIFAVNDNGEVKYFTPSKFGEKYEDKEFI